MICGDMKDYFFLADRSWFTYDEEEEMYILKKDVPEKARKSYEEYLNDIEEMKRSKKEILP